MAVIINATTTTGLTTSADNSGVIQFQSNGANTVGISSTGYITVGGNQQIYGPAFSAYQSGAQTLGSATATKITLGSELFDTANCFDTANSKFTPNVAGYYQINGAVAVGASSTVIQAYIYKNGNIFKAGVFSGSANVNGGTVSGIVYLNGTTDFVELYAYFGTGQITNSGSNYTYFDGAMVRGA